jgi:hypothetical protein
MVLRLSSKIKVSFATPSLLLRLYGRPSLPSGDSFHPSCRGLHPGRSISDSGDKTIRFAPNLVPGFLGRGVGARVGEGGPLVSPGNRLLGRGLYLRRHLPEFGGLARCFSAERRSRRKGVACGRIGHGPDDQWGLGIGDRAPTSRSFEGLEVRLPGRPALKMKHLPDEWIDFPPSDPGLLPGRITEEIIVFHAK